MFLAVESIWGVCTCRLHARRVRVRGLDGAGADVVLVYRLTLAENFFYAREIAVATAYRVKILVWPDDGVGKVSR